MAPKNGAIVSFLFLVLPLCSAFVETGESISTFDQVVGHDQHWPATKETHHVRLSTSAEDLLRQVDTVDDTTKFVSEDTEDNNPNQDAEHKKTQKSPNESGNAFGSILIEGPEEDVQSFDKKDGSHLELYDCPNTDASDYSIQSLKAVCMTPGEGSNCENIAKGGVEGTVVRLPADCGPDTYVRAISFDEILEPSVPASLKKQMLPDSKVYELRYDYDFTKIREDAGTINFQMDFSNMWGW